MENLIDPEYERGWDDANERSSEILKQCKGWIEHLIETGEYTRNHKSLTNLLINIQNTIAPTNNSPHFVYHHYYNGINKTGAEAYKWFLQESDYLDIEQEELLPFTIDIYFSDSETERISFKETMDYFISEAKKGTTILVSGRWYKDNRGDILTMLFDGWPTEPGQPNEIADLICNKFIIQSSIRGWVEYAQEDGFRAMRKNDFMNDSKNMNKLIESV